MIVNYAFLRVKNPLYWIFAAMLEDTVPQSNYLYVVC